MCGLTALSMVAEYAGCARLKHINQSAGDVKTETSKTPIKISITNYQYLSQSKREEKEGGKGNSNQSSLLPPPPLPPLYSPKPKSDQSSSVSRIAMLDYDSAVLLQTGIKIGVTTNGEMFSAQSMATFAGIAFPTSPDIYQRILQHLNLNQPDTSNDLQGPSSLVVIRGSVVIPTCQATVISSHGVEGRMTSCKPNMDITLPDFGPIMSDPVFCGRIHVMCLQGKSRYPGLWPLVDLLQSNRQLVGSGDMIGLAAQGVNCKNIDMKTLLAGWCVVIKGPVEEYSLI